MSIPEVFPRTPTTALDDLWAAFIDQGWVGFEAAKARYRPAIEAAARLEVEARAPLLAELRAQAFGEPRWVPLATPSTEAGRTLLDWWAGKLGAETDAKTNGGMALAILAIEAEARAPLLAELRAQAFGEPRCVPLSVIERIFSALEEPTDD